MRERPTHLYDYGLGKYYGFAVCGNKADRSRLMIDPVMVTCLHCKRTNVYKGLVL